MPDSSRLRCVHCHTTETPLWRTGPDGPRSLCNACGVRFKKGKLVLYKDDQGNLTAVKLQDAVPVHVPPPAKKSVKRNVLSSSPPVPSSPTSDASIKRTARKLPVDLVSHVPCLAKNPRSRSRRANAGQLPGRYVSANLPPDAVQNSWRSPSDSPSSTPSSPTHSPRLSADRSTTLTTSSVVTDDFNPLNRVSSSDEDHLFSDMACLGLDASADPDNNTLLPLPADPSSAEQFSFAFSGLGRDAYLAFDAPDRTEALRALLLDRTRTVSQLYDSTIQAIRLLYEYRFHQRLEIPNSNVDPLPNVENCKQFVRRLARQDVGSPFSYLGTCASQDVKSRAASTDEHPTVMLPEKTLHSAAMENFRNLMDCTDLVGFAEAYLIELLADDVASSMCPMITPNMSCRLPRSEHSQPNVIASQALA